MEKNFFEKALLSLSCPIDVNYCSVYHCIVNISISIYTNQHSHTEEEICLEKRSL